MSAPPPGGGTGAIKEGPEAEQAIDESRRKTTPRPQQARSEDFQRLSPEPGVLDETAFTEGFSADRDAALRTLGAAHGSSDRRLRELAKRLAGRVVVDLARGDHAPRRGIDRLERGRWVEGADLDLEASLDALVDARMGDRPVDLDRLVASSWVRSEHALALVIDRSGSMSGDRLVAAALATAVMACRAPQDYSIIAMARDAIVVKAQDRDRDIEAVIDDVLALRGHGTTNVELGLQAAAAQLERSRSSRRIAVLLSDGNVTAGGDPADAARRLDELHVICPPDSPAATELARVGGGRSVELGGPSSVPDALLQLLR
ncbi:MAG: VWA domain-containing protein [Acidimicrobiia bacterium]|nr:VWA domain-containing protein [Acidimicrobiia bacterium]